MDPKNWLEEIKPYRNWFTMNPDEEYPSELNWQGLTVTKENCIPATLAKWQIIREYSVSEQDIIFSGVSAGTCALCRLYGHYSEDDFCGNCPIRNFHPDVNYHDQCRHTPYYEYINANTWKQGEEAAEDELKFLFHVFFPDLSEEEISDLVALGKPYHE